MNAYRIHRKYVILKKCLDEGIDSLLVALSNKSKLNDIFKEIGPPPGYSKDYFDNLEQTSKRDTLKANNLRFLKKENLADNYEHSSHIDLHEQVVSKHLRLMDTNIINIEQFIETESVLIRSKYQKSKQGDSSPLEQLSVCYYIRRSSAFSNKSKSILKSCY